MKKLLFLVVPFLFLVACGDEDVEIKIPATFLESEMTDLDETIASAEEEGIEVTQNDDGSLTYTMSKSKHDEMMDELKTELDNTIAEMTSSDEASSIRDVKIDKTYSEFTMIVDREAYENSFDGFAIYGLGMYGVMYQVFDGSNADDQQVTINVEDEATGEVFHTVNYPEDME
ncbi:hypothetical protein [Lentibacillus saliphilus]|uniref:hypothetical protein n=1 Tax=Lentibacillus saliphilus TaxID=2737028 RepID=UPI001C2FCE8C|nr:hypothetical protein [Lentibacillus saliphilus]